MPRDEPGRVNQRLRTRKDLLEAALKLSAEGRALSLEEVAEKAMVSRATAYRYFPSVDALLAEASLHVAFPDVEALFEDASAAPADRLKRLDEATSKMVRDNEAALRLMVASATRQALVDPNLPIRQNRRSSAIAAALEPCRDQFEPAAFEKLQKALALVIGTEAMLVFKDVLRLSDTEAAEVRRWAIDALLDKARA
jgi:AcrR family transcriptional regulator